MMPPFEANDLIGLIPAAGKGVRLKLPFPKELFPIIKDERYMPVAQSILEQITQAGVRQVVFVINPFKQQLIEYFGTGERFNCSISYVAQELNEEHRKVSVTPGLAEAMDAGYHLVKDKLVFFGMPDTIIRPADIYKRALSALEEDQDAIFCLFKATQPEKSGMTKLAADGMILEIVDKPPKTDLTWMWGTIIWKPSYNEFMHDCITRRQIFDYGTMMNEALKAGLKFGSIKFEDGEYIDLGTMEDISRLKEMKLGRFSI
jgi:glucose-1-phosphate thymidylyltransferase